MFPTLVQRAPPARPRRPTAVAAPACSADKAAVFVLEEFDLFASRRQKQTLLYNLLDALQTSGICAGVVGVSVRQDVMELLEKRVKSRFRCGGAQREGHSRSLLHVAGSPALTGGVGLSELGSRGWGWQAGWGRAGC
jgi:hypothetical protein